MHEKYRVWYIYNIPDGIMQYFPVKTIKEAEVKIRELTARDLKDNSIITNAMGLEEYDPCDGKYFEWYDDVGRDIDERMSEEDK